VAHRATPILNQQIGAAMSIPDSSLPPPGSRTILVVDDVGVVRQVCYRMLTESGYRVFEAASAVEALEVLATSRRPVDLAVVDVIMDEINGVDLVRMISQRWPATKVLFMSANPAEVLVREGLYRPEVTFLAKPFTREELLEKVTAALRVQWTPDEAKSSSSRSY
jgi:two-component system cell cycle sensor histidine kinase/response regulator CckA